MLRCLTASRPHRQLLKVFRHATCTPMRYSSLATFLEATQHLQSQQTAIQSQDTTAASTEEKLRRMGEVVRQGKHLFDTDTVEDFEAHCTPAFAATMAQAATQWRISPLRGQPYNGMLLWSSSEKAEATMDLPSIARIIHSALVLRAPQLYPLLITYIPFLLRHLGEETCSVDAATLAVIFNAYGRAEVRHDGLYQLLCKHGAVAFRDPALAVAHVANVAYAAAKVHVTDPSLLSTLRDQASRQVAAATPLMSITILNAVAELGFIDAELFETYEAHLQDRLASLSPALLSSLLHSMVKANRGDSALVARIGEQVSKTAATFDAFAIAKVMSAYYVAGKFSEEVFGALAERACAVAVDFRSEEVANVLEALSAFDLYDGELYPLLAARIAVLVKQAAPITMEDAATVLASFASVQESNDELNHWCGKVFTEHTTQATTVFSASVYINVLWACLQLNIRSEPQKRLLAAVVAKPSLLLPLPAEAQLWHKQKRVMMSERTAAICRANGIPAPQPLPPVS